MEDSSAAPWPTSFSNRVVVDSIEHKWSHLDAGKIIDLPPATLIRRLLLRFFKAWFFQGGGFFVREK